MCLSLSSYNTNQVIFYLYLVTFELHHLYHYLIRMTEWAVWDGLGSYGIDNTTYGVTDSEYAAVFLQRDVEPYGINWDYRVPYKRIIYGTSGRSIDVGLSPTDRITIDDGDNRSKSSGNFLSYTIGRRFDWLLSLQHVRTTWLGRSSTFGF
jgi:hypothetical protein